MHIASKIFWRTWACPFACEERAIDCEQAFLCEQRGHENLKCSMTQGVKFNFFFKYLYPGVGEEFFYARKATSAELTHEVAMSSVCT